MPVKRRVGVVRHSIGSSFVREYLFRKGYWLAYKDGVYDISAFVENHPGGKQILKTAGKALEACWKIFTIHQIEHVYEILEEYRIGNLPPGKTREFR